jgi:hypothetical protein
VNLSCHGKGRAKSRGEGEGAEATGVNDLSCGSLIATRASHR